jgi:hypothetical protein
VTSQPLANVAPVQPIGAPAQPVGVPAKPVGVSVYSKGLTIGDLAVLAKSLRNGGEDDVQIYYGWRDSRSMTVAKGFAWAALSLLIAWLIPYLKGEFSGSPAWLAVVPPILIILGAGAVALTAVMRLDRIHASFVQAMVWLQQVR